MSTKVLFVHDGPLYKDKNGNYYGVHFNDELRKRYLNLGNSVTFLMRVYPMPDNDVSKYSLIEKENFGVIEVPNFKSFRLYFKKRKEVNEIVENAVLNHDVIMARLPSATGSLSVKYALKHHKPLITEVVACNWDSFWYYNWKGKLVAPYFYFKQKWIMKKIKYAIYVTKHFLQHRYPSNGKTINCSNVELKETDNSVMVERLKKIKNLDTDKSPLVIGTVAAIDVPYKGQSDVIKAVSQLIQKGIKVKYKIVGQGNPKVLSNLIAQLGMEEHVEIVGALKHDEIFNFLDTVDLYIQPSKQEGLPRAMLEAMSRGCPCMGANTAGIPELINKKYIFNKGDVTKIAGLIADIKKEDMLVEANINFEEAKNYKKATLTARRMNFYAEFLRDYKLPINKNLQSLVTK